MMGKGFFERRIYGGILRIPSIIRHQLGDKVYFIPDYRSAIIINPDADPELVARSLEVIIEDLKRRKKSGKKG